MAEGSVRTGSVETWTRIGALAAVIAVLATAYFSIRSERTKEITVTYLSKRPLVSLEGGRPSAALEVTLGDKRIAAPWLLSAKIENTGNQPIEERDIEAPPKLAFSRGKILGAEVVQKSQNAMFAKAGFSANEVAIEHKLLNPGDWISFDVLFDGEPDSLPALSFRISGISEPTQRTLSPGEKKSYLTLVPLPFPVTYLLLTLGSLLGLVGTFGGLTLAGTAIRNTFRPVRSDDSDKGLPERILRRLSFEVLAPGIIPHSRAARILCAAIPNDLQLDWLDQPNSLRAVINEHVSQAILESLQLDGERAAELLRQELKESLKDSLASRVYTILPSGPDNLAMEEMLKLDITAMSASDMLKRAKDLAASGRKGASVAAHRMDTGEFAEGCVIFVAGLSLLLLLGGTWRTLFGI